MGTGYTRNDTSNNIADGNIINAADFDGEYDAIEAAFNSSTGHTHDGTSAEGAPITVLGPSQEFVASSSEVKPSTNAGLDLGTSALKFKDLYLDGTAYIDGLGGDILAATDKKIQFRDTAIFINSSADGQLDIDADTTIELNSPEVIATDDFRLKSDAAILTFGADNDVTVTHVADTGLDAKAASGFNLKLQTGDTTVEDTNTIGKISFNAPDEASGTDAILVGAEIEAAAEATFSSTVNSTALVFKTNDSAAATERFRIKSNGDIVIKGDSYDVTWDASADAFITDSNNDIKFQPHGTGSVAITGALDVDNINIDGNTIISTDTDGDINITPNGTGKVNIAGGIVPSEIALTSTDGGAAKGPQLDIFRDSASPANGDAIGYIDFSGDDDAGNKTVYASVLATATDVANGSEDGTLKVNTMVAGSDTTILTVDADGLDVNGNVTVNGQGVFQTGTGASLITLKNTDSSISGGESIQMDWVYGDTANSTSWRQLSRFAGNQFQWFSNIDDAGYTLRMNLYEGGDFALYEDTGTTAEFYWDASAENLGIGTTTPGRSIHIEDDTYAGIRLDDTGGTAGASTNAAVEFYSGGVDVGNIGYETGGGYMSMVNGYGPLAFNSNNSSNSASVSNAIWYNTANVFNESGSNLDFRVESVNNSNMLVVDADQDCVTIGSTVTSSSALHVESSGAGVPAISARGNSQANGMVIIGDRYADDESQATFGLGYADATVVLGRNCKPHPSQSAIVSSQDTYSNQPTLIRIQNGGIVVESTPTGAVYTTDSTVTLYNYFQVASDTAVFNEDSLDRDFRVESNAFPHIISVQDDAVMLGDAQTRGGTGGWTFYPTGSGGMPYLVQNKTASGSTTAYAWQVNSSTVGSITFASTGVTYLTTSDQRLKTDIEPIADGTEKLMAMNPVTHKWKAEPEADAVVGFIAQEMQEIVPEAVSGDPDGEEMMSMDYGRITPVLVAALQDAHKKIEALEERLTELEAK